MKLYANIVVYGDSVESSISDNLHDMETQHTLAVANMQEGRNFGSLLLEVDDITKYKVNVITYEHRCSADIAGCSIIGNECQTNDSGEFYLGDD